jgi:hypothetical protein
VHANILKEEIEMNAYETFALSHHLSEFDVSKSYEEVLELIRSEEGEVVIWEPFDGCSGEQVAEWIEDMKVALEVTFTLTSEAEA